MAHAHAHAQVMTTLVDELGTERLSAIATIDPTPLSVASIAQARAHACPPCRAHAWACYSPTVLQSYGPTVLQS